MFLVTNKWMDVNIILHIFFIHNLRSILDINIWIFGFLNLHVGETFSPIWLFLRIKISTKREREKDQGKLKLGFPEGCHHYGFSIFAAIIKSFVNGRGCHVALVWIRRSSWHVHENLATIVFMSSFGLRTVVGHTSMSRVFNLKRLFK
jgi:hypothetical protein